MGSPAAVDSKKAILSTQVVPELCNIEIKKLALAVVGGALNIN